LVERLGSDAVELERAFAQWCFHQTGIVRVEKMEHSLAKDFTLSTEYYTVMKEWLDRIKISELSEGGWVLFKGQDVLMVYVRIDPFVMQSMMIHIGKLTATFTISDVYGLFQFKINSRLRLIRVFTNMQVKSNKMERFIVTVFSMIGGVVLSIVFLHFKD